MASGCDLQGLSRILKLSLNAAMANRAKPQTTLVSIQDDNQVESTSKSKGDTQNAESMHNVSQHHLKESSVHSCIKEDGFRGHAYKHGRGRGLQQHSHNLLQEKDQKSKAASNSCGILPAYNLPMTDPVVCTEGSEDVKTSRDVTVSTPANNLDHREEQCQDMIMSSKAGNERLSVKQLGICELPDLVKCQVFPEETTEMLMAEKPISSISGMRQPAVNKLPLADLPEKATRIQAASGSSLSSSSLVTRKYMSGTQRKYSQVSSQSTNSRTGKQAPLHRNVSRGTVVRQAFQEHGSRYRDQQVKPCQKTGVNFRPTNNSQYAKKSPVENQHGTYVRESRWMKSEFVNSNKQNQCKETCSGDRDAFKCQVLDSNRKDAGYKVNEFSKEAARSPGVHMPHKMSTSHHNRVSKHVEPVALVTNERKAADSNPLCQEKTELGKQSVPDQPDNLTPLSLNINKNTADLLEQDLTTNSGAGSIDPSVYEIINAIYQSYMIPDNDGHPEIIQTGIGTENDIKRQDGLDHLCDQDIDSICKDISHTQERREVLTSDQTVLAQKARGLKGMTASPNKISSPLQSSLTAELCSKSCSDFVSSACSEVNSIEGVNCPQCVSRKCSLPSNWLNRQCLSNSDSCCNNYPQCHISSCKVSKLDVNQSEVVFVPPEGQSEVVFVPPEGQSEVVFVPPEGQSEAVFVPPEGQSEAVFVPPEGQSEVVFVSPEGQSEAVFVPPEGQSEVVFVPPEGQSEVVFVSSEGQSEAVFVPPEGQSEVVFVPPDNLGEEMPVPPGDQSEEIFSPVGIESKMYFPVEGQLMEVPASPDVHSDEETVLDEAHTSRPCVQPNASRKCSDQAHHYMPCFQTRELSLPAENMGSRLAMERMVAFIKSCSTDIQEHVYRHNEEEPLDVSIRISLSPPLSSSRHSHNLHSSQSQRFQPHYYAFPFMFQPPKPLPPPPPPSYWHWGPSSQWCSPDMGTPTSNIHSLNDGYPGMMHRPPAQDNSDRRMPVPGYYNPWMYSSWNPSQFDYKQHGPDRTQACPKEDLATHYNHTHPLVDYSDYSDRQQQLCDPETETSENSVHEVQITKSASSPVTNKWHQNNDMNVSDSCTWDDASTVNVSVSQVKLSQKADNSTRHLHATPVSSFLTAQHLENNWSGRTPPPASNSFTNHLIPQAACPSTSLGSSLSPVNMQTNISPAPTPTTFISKVTKKSWIKQNKYQPATWRQQRCPAATDFEQVPCEPDIKAWRRHSFPQERQWTGHAMASPENKANEVQQPQPSQVKRHLSSPSEERAELSGSRFWRSNCMEKDGTQASEMTAMTPLQASKAAHNKKRAQAIEQASLLVSRSRAYKYTFVDCHCHIDFLYSKLDVHRGTAFSKFRENYADSFPHNYEGCVAVFCNPNTFTANKPKDQILRSISTEAGVWLAVGCHPKNAIEFEDTHLKGLRHILQHPKVVALGEIGLDYSSGWDQHSEKQKEVFKQQLHLALEMRLPLVIHCRDADDDCLEILVQIVPRYHKIHAHCFTRDITVAQRWMNSFPNLFVGLTPVITYKTAVEAANTAMHIPLDRLLLETDAPYFVPGNLKNGALEFSHPGLALCTAERVAELRRIPVDEVLRACRENTHKMYGI